MTVQTLKRLFTAAEYHQMTEAGIFSEDDRVDRKIKGVNKRIFTIT